MEEVQGEEVLHGGNTNVVVRVGDTVRRHTGHWTPAVHALLAHLDSVGFADAPAVRGTDDRGREVLSYVIGEVGLLEPCDPIPPWFRTTEACIAIGDWLRRFHDAQRGFTPDPSLPWRMYAGRALHAGEVVVHHDAAPYNTIRRPDGGLTVIDWDFCGPGENRSRIWHSRLGSGFPCGPTRLPWLLGTAEQCRCQSPRRGWRHWLTGTTPPQTSARG